MESDEGCSEERRGGGEEEEERLEEERQRKEEWKRLEMEVKEFEEDVRRFKEEEDRLKAGEEEGKRIDANSAKGKRSSNVKKVLAPLPKADPPSLTIRETEKAYRAIEAQDLLDVSVNMPGIEIAKTKFAQRTTKRALEAEIAEAVKRKRRHLGLLESYDEGFDGAFLVQGQPVVTTRSLNRYASLNTYE